MQLVDPTLLGFQPLAIARDRFQLAFVRAVMLAAPGRLVVKGGMAIRAELDGVRMTEDVDFDRAAGISLEATANAIRQGLKQACIVCGVHDAQIAESKKTTATLRIKLHGTLPEGGVISFKAEASGPQPAFADRYKTVVPIKLPPAYRLPPIALDVYPINVLLATKIAALMSPERNVPRDVYDIKRMLDVGATPEGLNDLVSKEALALFAGEVWAKVDGIEYNAFRTELLPFIGQADAASITNAVWASWCTDVAAAIEEICHDASS